MKPSATKSVGPREPAETVLPDPHGVDVSITNERGKTERYLAQSVTLKIARGGLEVLHDRRGCYAWFEHCRLEARAGRKRVVLRFASGVVSSRGTALTVVAANDPSFAVLPKIPATKRPTGKSKTKRQPKLKSPS